MAESQVMSAYAVYKRQVMEQAPHSSKKVKQQHLSREISLSDKNLKAKRTKRQPGEMTTKKNQVNGDLDIFKKLKKGIVSKRIRTVRNKKKNKKEKSSGIQLPIRILEVSKNVKTRQKSRLLNGEKDDRNMENKHHTDPIKDSRDLFQWLIHPMEAQDFLENYFEKRPMHVQRDVASYYLNIVSTSILDKVLREKNVFFTKNIDITSYTNGMRETHNPTGRAVANAVWDYYINKCSVRMLNPQTFIQNIYMLNAILQEYFGCFVGSNLYLTPPGSQGFAPHYDDIEAFVLQVEGKKRWRLYKPPDKSYLARYSSRNFDESEIGEPILDTILTAGDLLYFPRGTIHQAETADDAHSLHITLSVYQKNSWYDFLEKLLPLTLKRAAEENYKFREGLPLDYLRYVGTAHTTSNEEAREIFGTKVKAFLTSLINYIDIDSAADLMAKSHIHDFLPPVPSLKEKECSVAQDGDIMTDNGFVRRCAPIEPDTRVRLIRSHCIRLVKEEDGAYRIYYSTENSKEYHEYELQFVEVDEEFVPAVREIIRCYPRFIRVSDLPIDYDDYKIQIVKDLWEKGLLIMDNPRRNIMTKKSNKGLITKKKR
ncbi:PREDICTED: bifunctional lysine-specific demethylase and histidyl-hydroxylase NO66 [Dinoponera quadriceps]|uniref:Bifunctional lysine-specific demethylase and histidyl-hydroxylase n=1 Tax=Dinoponera quadriceps TaxID=609295 RepID=A0A6P3XD69_DINQU|nr:PREDICTED: bifunctional lysine-specific demethylase and histidyl-hydroxylase NO66 [Dinoponera quadriceps]XP_014476291.1 PREDICTED: bifunctional lysine-specific demethylase and histidyl-hydroxylase NO66 [Dinoponera quadriceps]XP_014476292.1 PREDICTED: bifunctional lysine-specific demethylase and histidyl-hydroxylase NO66 [Dinoponera quadriceps]